MDLRLKYGEDYYKKIRAKVKKPTGFAVTGSDSAKAASKKRWDEKEKDDKSAQEAGGQTI